MRVMLFISLEQEAHNSKPMCLCGRWRRGWEEGGTAAAGEINLEGGSLGMGGMRWDLEERKAGDKRGDQPSQ